MENTLGKEHWSMLTSVRNLAEVLWRQENYGAAEERSRRALHGMEKVLGLEEPATLESVTNLTRALRDQGKLEAAEEMNGRALDGYEKVLGYEHLDTMGSVCILTGALLGQGKRGAAEEMVRRALETVWGKDYPETSSSVSCLTNALYRYKDAIKTRRARICAGHPKVLVINHPATLAWSD